MRLRAVERGHRIGQKAMLGLIGLITRRRATDMLRTVFYRAEFFGRPAGAWTEAVMRGPSRWTVGERELFAAFTSRLNRCPFCTGAHGAIASKALGDPHLVDRVLENWRTAPIDERLRAMLCFIEKLTLDPTSVSSVDVEPLRALGLPDDAIEDAVHVCALFNMINRIADALGFEVPDAEAFEFSAVRLLKRGYQ